MTEISLELITAQQQLEAKRAQLATSASTSLPISNLMATLLETSPTDPTNGDEVVNYCVTHRAPEPCEECARQAEEATRRRQSKATAALAGINIGTRYAGMTFADFDATSKGAQKILTICSRYAETFPDRLRSCDNLLMLGNPGTGKNMLAACICQSVAGQGYSAIHTTAMKLIRKVKESWGKGAAISEQEAINQFSKPDLLVVDEVGVQYGSDTEKILLFEVINDRYEAMRPTVIISNLNITEVEAFLGARIMDRFHEGKSSVLEFNWESYRRRVC